MCVAAQLKLIQFIRLEFRNNHKVCYTNRAWMCSMFRNGKSPILVEFPRALSLRENLTLFAHSIIVVVFVSIKRFHKIA